MITISLGKAVAAYKAIVSISTKDFSMMNAYRLYTLKKKLQDQYDFQIEQERIIIDKYDGKVNQSGTCTFKDQNVANQVKTKLKELRETIVELDIDKIQIKFDETITLTIKDIEAIDDFVDIIE